MNVIRRIVVAIAGVVAVALVVALAEPKVVHAVVSALVTVSNTVTNPVPTVPAQAANHFNVNGACAFLSGTSCTVAPIYTVPAGETAVLESASGRCLTDTGTGLAEVKLVTLTDNTVSYFVLGPPINATGLNVTSFAQNQNFYMSGGQGIGVVAFATTSQTATGSEQCQIDISGYLVQ